MPAIQKKRRNTQGLAAIYGRGVSLGVCVAVFVGEGVNVKVAVGELVGVGVSVDISVLVGVNVVVGVGASVTAGVLVGTFGTYRFSPTLIRVDDPRQFADCN